MSSDPLDRWLDALEKRHLAELEPREVARALKALSSLYVERRERLGSGAVFDGRGKRAAFALYYGPLHFLLAREVVRALGLAAAPPREILDLGCGTAVAGAAWALEAGGATALTGIEKNGWAVEEAGHTLRDLGLRGRVFRGDLAEARLPGPGAGIVAAWALNELPDATRDRMRERLFAAVARGARLLVLEPIASRPFPWWGRWAEEAVAAGGREDLWRFPARLPARCLALGKSAGLDPRELSARSLFVPGDRGGVSPAPPFSGNPVSG